MPAVGLEPTRQRHMLLRHTCIPISPHGLTSSGQIYYTKKSKIILDAFSNGFAESAPTSLPQMPQVCLENRLPKSPIKSPFQLFYFFVESVVAARIFDIDCVAINLEFCAERRFAFIVGDVYLFAINFIGESVARARDIVIAGAVGVKGVNKV